MKGDGLVERANAAYRAGKLRQIEALREKLRQLEAHPYAIDWLKRLRLRKKIDRLRGELDQAVLFTGRRNSN